MRIRTASVLLLTLLAAAPASAQVRRTRQAPTTQSITGTNGQVLGTTLNPGAALGGSFIPALGSRTAATPIARGIFKVSLGFTGTGWREQFVVGLPTLSSGPAPVLVLFHSYGEKPEDLVQNTELFAKARSRGWIVVAPLGAHQFNFGIDYSQINTARVMDWVAQYLTIDVERIYGAGFSMGGGWMNSFAARHQDPEGIRFAALVNHTGASSVSDVWWNAADTSLLESSLMFGGTPNTHPFRYSIASSMDVLQGSNTVDPTTDMLRNLSRTPVRSFAVQGEVNQYLVNQTVVFDDQYAQRGGTSDLTLVPGNQHAWSTIDEDATLDWLFQHTYSEPDPSVLHQMLADRDGRWDYFDLEQETSGSFSPFSWIAVSAMNRAYVTDTENVARIGFDPQDLGLDGSTTLEVVVSNADTSSTQVAVGGFTQPPTTVRRNGASTASWTWDAVTGEVVLNEPTGANFPIWQIVP